MTPKNPSIGIIGAGPAGLSLAKLLAEKGFSNITLFEARDRIGGKAFSVDVEGVNFNLGACYVTFGYGLVRRWLKDYGIRSKRLEKPVHVDQNNEKVEYIPYLLTGFTPGQALFQCLKYVFLWSRFYIHSEIRHNQEPAFLQQLAMPAREWFEQHRIPFLTRLCRRGFQVMGYGVLEEVPVLHVLRWVTPTLLISGILNLVYEVSNFQALFEKIAEQFRVRLNSPVSHIRKRDEGGFTVCSPSGETDFDVVVCACYLDELGEALADSGDAITDIANSLEFKRWVIRVAHIRAEDRDTFYQETIVNYPNTWEEVVDGKLVGFRKPVFVPETAAARSVREHTYIAGQVYYDAGNYSHDQSETMLKHELSRRNGSLHNVHHLHETRYSPTYKPEAVRANIMQDMRDLQGVNGLYFTGSTFSHESVKNIVNFNRYLADRIEFDLSPRKHPRLFQLKQLLKRLRPFNL